MNATIKKSSVFSRYNALRRTAPDTGRLNRALGIALRKDQEPRYRTTPTSCDCPDATYSRQVCKHRIALMLQEG